MARPKGSGIGSNTKDISKPIIKKVGFPKSGKGHISGRIGIPFSWLEQLGIMEYEPYVKVTFIDGKIIIEKVGE